MKLSIGYDGQGHSRPILSSDDTPPRMFSISELIDGKWQSFDGEDELCEAIMEAWSQFELTCADGHRFHPKFPPS